MFVGIFNIKEIGCLMFSEYVYLFEFVLIILLVGMIVVIVLIYCGLKKLKYINLNEQVFVKVKDCICVL